MHPIPEEGRTHRLALQFSSPAFLIVEESRREILSHSRYNQLVQTQQLRWGGDHVACSGRMRRSIRSINPSLNVLKPWPYKKA
jgi:hypothetical protein